MLSLSQTAKWQSVSCMSLMLAVCSSDRRRVVPCTLPRLHTAHLRRPAVKSCTYAASSGGHQPHQGTRSVTSWLFTVITVLRLDGGHAIGAIFMSVWLSVRQRGRFIETSLGNSGLRWTIFARNRDTAVPAEGNGDLQTLICVLVARSRRCLTSSNPVPWQNWMAAYLGYTLRMKTLFCSWPVMVHDTHTRRRRRRFSIMIVPTNLIISDAKGWKSRSHEPEDRFWGRIAF